MTRTASTPEAGSRMSGEEPVVIVASVERPELGLDFSEHSTIIHLTNPDDDTVQEPVSWVPAEEPVLTGVPGERPEPRWAESMLMASFEESPAAFRGNGHDPCAFGATASPSTVADESSGLRFGSVLRETLETIVLALLIFITVRAVIQNFKVEGSSMEPNLHSGQYLLVNKAAYVTFDVSRLAGYVPWLLSGENRWEVAPFGDPERGDVVVFQYPRDPRRDFIKRIIAVPGDTVTIREGRVQVNGMQIDEPYIIENSGYSREAVTVPPGQFYVLGDNRNNSSDSHVWGPVPRENMIGKAWLSYWPVNEWGLAPNYPVAAEN